MRLRGLRRGGTSGNELLTVDAGAVLLIPLALIGLTILRLGQLLWLHLFVGLLLIGPLGLKMASSGYRFLRYYSGNPPYRRVGPPAAALRLIAPIVVLSTVVVMVSGVALLFVGPQSRSTLLPLHKISFIVWIVFTALHVLGHLPALARGLDTEYRATRRAVLGGSTAGGAIAEGRAGRLLALASALAFGALIAVLCIPEFSPWLNAHFPHH